jgi:hypothetical protein
MRLLRRFTIAVSLIVALLVVFAGPCFAAGQHHAVASNDSVTSDGGYYDVVIQSLDAKWSSTYSSRFVLHTMWLSTGTDGSWIENGFMDGAHVTSTGSVVYHHGFYNAQGRIVGGNLEYEENTHSGPSTAVGTQHCFHIQRDGWQQWGVYVDFTRAKTYTAVNTAYDMDVGLESNDRATASAHWCEKNLELYRNGSWGYWTSGTLANTDHSPYYGIGVQWVTQPKSDGSAAPKIDTWDN